MTSPDPKVDAIIAKAKRWQSEFKALRTIALECGLTETLKWGQPCYVVGNKNIVLIHGFKEYCALLFFKGALLKDAKKLLIQQTENVQAARQIRFKNTQEITKKRVAVKAYIKEAIAAEQSGAKVKMKKTTAFQVPDEFKAKLKEMPALKKAFDALTPGRQRAYLLFFSAAKQSVTRAARIDKNIKRILVGKGLND